MKLMKTREATLTGVLEKKCPNLWQFISLPHQIIPDFNANAIDFSLGNRKVMNCIWFMSTILKIIS